MEMGPRGLAGGICSPPHSHYTEREAPKAERVAPITLEVNGRVRILVAGGTPQCPPSPEEPFNTRTAESTHREASSSPAPPNPGQQEARPQVKVGRGDKGLGPALCG